MTLPILSGLIIDSTRFAARYFEVSIMTLLVITFYLFHIISYGMESSKLSFELILSTG